jgi:hypothetical protein
LATRPSLDDILTSINIDRTIIPASGGAR